MLTNKEKKAVDQQMDAGRKMANGTMPLYMGFNTPDEIDHAIKWLIGKQKVKNIEVGPVHPSIFPLPNN